MKHRIELASLVGNPNAIGAELTVIEIDIVYYGPIKVMRVDEGGYVTIILSSAIRVGVCDEQGTPSSRTIFHFPSGSHLVHDEGQPDYHILGSHYQANITSSTSLEPATPKPAPIST